MAALSVLNPTLLDVAKSLNPDGSIAEIVELLNQSNPILEDMTFVEGNLPTGHRSAIRTGLPTPTWRKLYGFVQPTKSNKVQVTDACGMLEAFSEVDVALAGLSGNPAAFRDTEARAHIEGMAQEMAATLFYGDSATAPEEFTGLAPRFNSLSAQNADNIINASGSGSDVSSIWLINWAPNKVFGIYPKGSQAGLQQQDLGEQLIRDSSTGGMMKAYVEHFRWDCGLVVSDWRNVVRIANIEVSDFSTLANTKNLITWMTRAIHRLPDGVGRPAFYMNRKMMENLHLGVQEKVSSQLTWENVAGKPVLMFGGYPIRRCDQIVDTETAIA